MNIRFRMPQHLDNLMMGILLVMVLALSYIFKMILPPQYSDYAGIATLAGFFGILIIGYASSVIKASQLIVLKSILRGGDRDYFRTIYISNASKPVETQEGWVRQEFQLYQPLELDGLEFNRIVVYSPMELLKTTFFDKREITFMGFDITHPIVGLTSFNILGKYNDKGEYILHLTLRDAAYVEHLIPNIIRLDEVLKDGEMRKLKDRELNLTLEKEDYKKHTYALLEEAEKERIRSEERIGFIVDRHEGIAGLLKKYGSSSWWRKLSREDLIALGFLAVIVAIALYRRFVLGG